MSWWITDTINYYLYGNSNLNFPFQMMNVPEEKVCKEEELSQDFKKLIKNDLGVDYDFHFIVGNKVIYCHKIIIEIRSKTLSKLIENKTEYFLDEDPEIFQHFINYLYTGEIELNIEQSIKLYFISKKYGINELTNGLLETTLKYWSIENVIDEFLLIDKNNPSFSLFKIIIEDEFESIVKKNLILKFSEKIIIEILTNWEIDIEESELFQGILNWSENEIKKGKQDPLSNILSLIRFGLINQKLMNSDFKMFNNFNLKGDIRSKRHLKFKTNSKDLLISKDSKNPSIIIIEKLLGNNWNNSKSFGNTLTPFVYYEWTILSINKSDHSGMVFSITDDLNNSTFSTNSIGIGMSNSKYKIDKVISSCYANNNDKIGIWFRDKDVIFYKNNVEIGRSNLNQNKSYYPLSFLYYQGDKVSLKISKKE